MDKGEAIMPTPEGILSTSTGAVDQNAISNQDIEETAQDITTSEEETDTESEVVEGGSQAEEWFARTAWKRDKRIKLTTSSVHHIGTLSAILRGVYANTGLVQGS